MRRRKLRPREGRAQSKSPLRRTKETCKQKFLIPWWVNPLSHKWSKRIERLETWRSKVKAMDRKSFKNLRFMSKNSSQVNKMWKTRTTGKPLRQIRLTGNSPLERKKISLNSPSHNRILLWRRKLRWTSPRRGKKHLRNKKPFLYNTDLKYVPRSLKKLIVQ